MGRVNPFEVQFSPWMTTVIGSRGTGKSSLVEFVRHALNRGDELPMELKTEFSERYAADDRGRGSKGLLLSNAECEIIFRKDGTRLRVRYLRENNQRIIEEQSTTGEWVISPGTTENFRVRIYSQRQIFQLARDPARFLEEIDRSPEVGRDAWKIEWDQAVHRYKSTSAHLRAERSKLAEEPTSKGELADVIRWLELREEAGNKEVLQRYQKTQSQLAELKNWSADIENLASILENAAADVKLPAFDATRFQEADDTEAAVATVTLVRKLTTISEFITGLKTTAEEACNEWRLFLTQSIWAARVTTAENAYRVLATQLGAGGANDALEYETKLKRRQTLEEKQKQFDAIRVEITLLESELSSASQALADHRQALTDRRKAFLRNTLAGLSDISIEIVPFGNHEDALDEFAKLVRKQEIREYLLKFEAASATGLFYSLYSGKYQPVVDFPLRFSELKGKIASIQAGDIAATAGLSALPVRWLKALTPEDIDAIQTWYPKDSVQVKYRARPGDSLRPLEQGSPGQQTAALLLFLMSYGTEPLMLDQPEDDLDNRMIYEALTRQFADLKRRRQLIIVTHNANIVVNGDSELVVCLESEGGQTVLTAGGLQEESVRRIICEVMEGGETAFDLRYRRIREDLIGI